MTTLRGRFSHWIGIVGLAATVAGGWGCGSVSPATPGDGAAGGSGGGGGGMTGGDAAAGSPAVVTAEQACNQVAKALCDTLDGCAQTLLKLLYGDKAVCISRNVLSCTTDQRVPGIARTPEDLVACAQGASTAACGDILAGIIPATCAIKPGTVINGAACGSDLQCQSTYCNKTGACGVCSPRQAAGGDCTTDAGCAAGLICAAAKCVMPGGLEADCRVPALPCRGDLFCTKAGKCKAKAGVGGSCADTPAEECNFSKGAVCTGLNMTCEMAAIAKGGEACGAMSKTACVGGLEPCSNFFLGGGICANPAGDGEACGGNKKCIPPAICQMSVCRLPSATDCH